MANQDVAAALERVSFELRTIENYASFPRGNFKALDHEAAEALEAVCKVVLQLREAVEALASQTSTK